MQDQARGAARARRAPAAGEAQQGRRESAPIDEDEALLAGFQPASERFDQRLRQAFAQAMPARVYAADARQLRAVHAAAAVTSR